MHLMEYRIYQNPALFPWKQGRVFFVSQHSNHTLGAIAQPKLFPRKTNASVKKVLIIILIRQGELESFKKSIAFSICTLYTVYMNIYSIYTLNTHRGEV